MVRVCGGPSQPESDNSTIRNRGRSAWECTGSDRGSPAAVSRLKIRCYLGQDGGDCEGDRRLHSPAHPERFWLVFQHRTAQLQLRITPSRGGWELHGRLDPPDSLQAELEIDGSDVALVESASRGEFTLRGAPPGVIRVIVTSDPRTVLLQTDWFVLGALPAA